MRLTDAFPHIAAREIQRRREETATDDGHVQTLVGPENITSLVWLDEKGFTRLHDDPLDRRYMPANDGLWKLLREACVTQAKLTLTVEKLRGKWVITKAAL